MPLNRIALKGSTLVISIVLIALLYMTELCLFCALSLAQASENNFATSAGKTIEVKADLVERNDQNGTAIFRGNAFAAQGGMKLTSREIYVTYNATRDKAASKDATSIPYLNEAGKGIIQIEARGSVLVTMPSGSQARSDLASLDVKKQQLTLGGEVILSQGENAMRGTELIVDLATGVSKFRSVFNDRFGERYQRFTLPHKHMEYENK